MKKAKTTSKLYILFLVMIFVALACVITALCLCDYNFKTAFVDVWQANKPSFILAAALVLRVKNDELTKSEVSLAFQVATVLLLEVILCVPILIVWIIERIHDAVSDRHREVI